MTHLLFYTRLFQRIRVWMCQVPHRDSRFSLLLQFPSKTLDIPRSWSPSSFIHCIHIDTLQTKSIPLLSIKHSLKKINISLICFQSVWRVIDSRFWFMTWVNKYQRPRLNNQVIIFTKHWKCTGFLWRDFSKKISKRTEVASLIFLCSFSLNMLFDVRREEVDKNSQPLEF